MSNKDLREIIAIRNTEIIRNERDYSGKQGNQGKIPRKWCYMEWNLRIRWDLKTNRHK